MPTSSTFCCMPKPPHPPLLLFPLLLSLCPLLPLFPLLLSLSPPLLPLSNALILFPVHTSEQF